MSLKHALAKTFGVAQADLPDGLDGLFFRRWFSFIGLCGPLFLLYVEHVSGKDTELNRDIVGACRDVMIWISAIYLLGSSAQHVLMARFGGAMGQKQAQEPTLQDTYMAPIGRPALQVWQPGEDSANPAIDDPDARRRR